MRFDRIVRRFWITPLIILRSNPIVLQPENLIKIVLAFAEILGTEVMPVGPDSTGLRVARLVRQIMVISFSRQQSLSSKSTSDASLAQKINSSLSQDLDKAQRLQTVLATTQ